MVHSQGNRFCCVLYAHHIVERKHASEYFPTGGFVLITVYSIDLHRNQVQSNIIRTVDTLEDGSIVREGNKVSRG